MTAQVNVVLISTLLNTVVSSETQCQTVHLLPQVVTRLQTERQTFISKSRNNDALFKLKAMSLLLCL